MEESGVIRVSRKSPCPICGKPDWCTISADGAIAVCMRVESHRMAKNGGFIHRITDEPSRPIPTPRPIVRSILANAADMIDHWTAETSLEALYAFAGSIGVQPMALAEIGACWAAAHGAWAFPMRDGSGRTVGIRLRAEDGRKWAVTGSREGLFYPERVPDDHVAVVCEGPTDTAAALSIGLWAVGRPSCAGAVDHVKAMFDRLFISHLIIVADNDTPKQRPDGSWWIPGHAGAMRLAEAVKRPFKVVLPPVKDMRQWVTAGLNSETFNALHNGQKWRNHGW